jgi:glyoxylase-like metal-dependent hydrolase (beta-lactamase superfamily II)
MSKKSDGVFQFKIGNFECIAINDGNFVYTGESFFINAPKKHLDQVLREHNIQSGEITTPWPCLFINTGKHRVLVDTGAGDGTVPSAGKLLERLKNEGVDAKDIDTVILTHGHPDHIGGNLDASGKPAFPNARYVMLKDEWDFWMSKPNFIHLKLGDELKQFIVLSAQKNLPPIQENLVLVDHGTAIIPGIVAIAAPGHTPGHMALAISSGGERLLHISDTVLYPIHMEQPDWYPAFDFEPEQASVTKHKLLNRAAAEKAMVFAFHFPFPCLGHVIKKGKAWQWQSV